MKTKHVCEICGGSRIEAIYTGHGTVTELNCSACLAADRRELDAIEAFTHKCRTLLLSIPVWIALAIILYFFTH